MKRTYLSQATHPARQMSGRRHADATPPARCQGVGTAPKNGTHAVLEKALREAKE